MALTTGDKVGIGVGVGIAAFIGYELWKSSKSVGSVSKNLSPNNMHLYSSNNYRFNVNQAQGYSETLPNGQHKFIFGQYPVVNGVMSQTFVPTGKSYIWGSGVVAPGAGASGTGNVPSSQGGTGY